MDREQSSDRIADTLNHLCRYWEERRKSNDAQFGLKATQPFTIAMSREAGTHGAAIGREVGARLGWHVYDHELLERIALDLGVRTALLETVDERRQGWLKESFELLFDAPFVSESAYVHRLVKTILALGAQGECVIVGRGSPFILPPANTLRVRLTAPRHERIVMLSRELEIPPEETARQLEGIERARLKFVRDYFFKDAADPKNYDLMLCVTTFGIAGCADLIVDAMKRRQAGYSTMNQTAPKADGKRGAVTLVL